MVTRSSIVFHGWLQGTMLRERASRANMLTPSGCVDAEVAQRWLGGTDQQGVSLQQPRQPCPFRVQGGGGEVGLSLNFQSSTLYCSW